MRSVILALVAGLTLSGASARQDVALSVPELIAAPKAQLGKFIVIRRIRCVDPGGAGFVCAALHGQRALRIEAGPLGPLTEVATAEKLIRSCKGKAKLESPVCTFDITITPSSTYQDDGAGGSGTVTVIVAPGIEMYPPRRI